MCVRNLCTLTTLLRSVETFTAHTFTLAQHGGIAFMRPGSSGVITGNTFATCPGTPLFYDINDPGHPEWVVTNNTIDGADGVTLDVVDTPVVTATPTSGGGLLIAAKCATPGAVLRYTVDSSLPTAASPVFPAAGLKLGPLWRALAVFVKAFPPPGASANGVVRVVSSVEGGFFAPQ